MIRTELNWVQTKASLDAMESAGLETYQYMAALDRRTCARCGSLDGEIFPLSEKEQGENAPPLHPRCRCTICVSFSEGKRSAKVDGKRVKIPSSMTYADWREVYVEGTVIPSGKFPFKRQAHFSSSNENILATNPNYNSGRAYQINCQKCVPTYEMRMRGYDVMARPTYDLATDKFASKHWKEAFKNAVVIDCPSGSGKDEIIAQLEKWGDSIRAEIYIALKGGGAHVFVGENRNGVIHFLDPQTGELDVEYYFDNVEKGFTKFLRIDNLEINEEYIKLCCKGVK